MVRVLNTSPKKILIVDDDLLTIATMAQTLLRNGYQVMHATDEAKAFKSTKKDRPDLIICNAESKSLDVQQLLKSIHNARPSQGIPLLLITESGESLSGEPGILGPKQRLSRPFTREQLTIAVQENLKRLPLKRK
jgi:two-component system OmpR family response regulator